MPLTRRLGLRCGRSGANFSSLGLLRHHLVPGGNPKHGLYGVRVVHPGCSRPRLVRLVEPVRRVSLSHALLRDYAAQTASNAERIPPGEERHKSTFVAVLDGARSRMLMVVGGFRLACWEGLEGLIATEA